MSRTHFKNTSAHAGRRKHFAARDAEVARRFALGHTTQRMMIDMGLGRSSIQDSLSRIKTAGGIDLSTRGKTLSCRVEEYRVWLFDISNATADPCLKWLEIFGEERW